VFYPLSLDDLSLENGRCATTGCFEVKKSSDSIVVKDKLQINYTKLPFSSTNIHYPNIIPIYIYIYIYIIYIYIYPNDPQVQVYTPRELGTTLKIHERRTGKCMITKMNITALPQAKAAEIWVNGNDPASCRDPTKVTF